MVQPIMCISVRETGARRPPVVCRKRFVMMTVMLSAYLPQSRGEEGLSTDHQFRGSAAVGRSKTRSERTTRRNAGGLAGSSEVRRQQAGTNQARTVAAVLTALARESAIFAGPAGSAVDRCPLALPRGRERERKNGAKPERRREPTPAAAAGAHAGGYTQGRADLPALRLRLQCRVHASKWRCALLWTGNSDLPWCRSRRRSAALRLPAVATTG